MALQYQYTFDTGDFTEFDERVYNPPSSIYVTTAAKYGGSYGARVVTTDATNPAYVHDRWDAALEIASVAAWVRCLQQPGAVGKTIELFSFEQDDNPGSLNAVAYIGHPEAPGYVVLTVDETDGRCPLSSGIPSVNLNLGSWYLVQLTRTWQDLGDGTWTVTLKLHVNGVLIGQAGSDPVETPPSKVQGLYVGIGLYGSNGVTTTDLDTFNVYDAEEVQPYPPTDHHRGIASGGALGARRCRAILTGGQM